MSVITDRRVKGYDLSPPSRDYVIDKLSRFMAEDDAMTLWESACVTHNVLASSENLDELENVFGELADQPGVVGVVGKSLLVRMNSYKLLKRKQHGNERS